MSVRRLRQNNEAISEAEEAELIERLRRQRAPMAVA